MDGTCMSLQTNRNLDEMSPRPRSFKVRQDDACEIQEKP